MSSDDPSIRRALSLVRAAWALAAGSQVLLLVAMVALVAQPFGDAGRQPGLLYLCIGVLVGGTMLAYFTRNQLYKRYWREHVIAPVGYVAGNLVLLGALAGASTLALVSTWLAKALLPYVAVSGVALVLMLLNVPRGRPMLPHEPRLGPRH